MCCEQAGSCNCSCSAYLIIPGPQVLPLPLSARSIHIKLGLCRCVLLAGSAHKAGPLGDRPGVGGSSGKDATGLNRDVHHRTSAAGPLTHGRGRFVAQQHFSSRCCLLVGGAVRSCWILAGSAKKGKLPHGRTSLFCLGPGCASCEPCCSSPWPHLNLSALGRGAHHSTRDASVCVCVCKCILCTVWRARLSQAHTPPHVHIHTHT